MNTDYTILHLEDSASDAALVELEIQKTFSNIRLDQAQTKEEFLEFLGQCNYDLILADFNIPGFYGLEIFRETRKRDVNVPFIFVSGVIGEERTIEILRSGVRDYVLKDNLSKLPFVIERVINEANEGKQKKIAEENLIESELFKTTILESLSSHIVVIDIDGNVLSKNSPWQRFVAKFSLNKEEKQNFWSFFDDANISPNIIDDLRNAVSQVIGGKKNYIYLDYSIQNDEVKNWYTIRVNRYLQKPWVVITQSNITDLKKIEEKISESEQRFRTFTENSPSIVMVINKAGVIKYVNRAFSEGRHAKDLIESSVYEKFDKQFRAYVKAKITTLMKTRKQVFFEAKLNRDKGNPAWVSIHAGLVSKDLDQVDIILDIQDITMNKLAALEKENLFHTQNVLNELLQLSHSQTSLRQILIRALDITLTLPFINIQSKGALFLADENENLEMVAVRNMDDSIIHSCSFVHKGECVCGKVAETKDPIYSPYVENISDDFLAMDEKQGRYVVPIMHKEKLEGVITLYLDPGMNGSAQEMIVLESVANTLGTIIEKRKAEERVRQSEERLKEAQKIAKLGNWELNLKTDKLYWSDEVYSIFGLTKEIFGGDYSSFLNTVHPDDRKIVDQAYKLHLENRAPYSIQHRILMPNGDIKYLQEECYTEFDEHDNAIKSKGTVQDITELRKSYKLLEESQQRYKSLFQNVKDAVISLDETGKITAFNKVVPKLLGYSAEELYNIRIPDIVHPGDKKKSRTYFNRLRKNGYYENYEGRILKKSGEIVWLQVNSTAVYDDNGEYLGATDIARDITERKLMEENLNIISEITSAHGGDEYFEQISNLLCTILKVKYAFIGRTMNNQSEIETLGFSIGGKTKKNRTIPLSGSPLEKVVHEGRVMIENGAHISYPDSAILSKYKINSIVAVPLMKGEETAGMIVIMCQEPIENIAFKDDILSKLIKRTETELQRTLSQRLLKINEMRFRGLIENSSEITTILDEKGTIKFITPSVLKVMGFEINEIVGHNVFEYIHPEDKQEAMEGFNFRKEEGGIAENYLIARFLTKSGNYKYFRIISSNHFDTPGINGFITNSQDVTELIMVQREKYLAIMRTEENERQRISRDLHDGLGQSIAAANMYFNTLETFAKSQFDDKAYTIYERGKKLINNAAKETRIVSHNIMPPSLKHFGFNETIGELISDYQLLNTSVKFSFHSNLTENKFSEEVGLALYRVIQELISNAIKHAKASFISLNINFENNLLNIVVSDDGSGFEMEAVKSRKDAGIGLRSVQQRVTAIGGKINFTTKESEGTIVRIQLSTSN